MKKATTYWDYIKVEKLLDLQRGVDTSEAHLANDEVMFITIHQIDELWFKLALRELTTVRNLFNQERVPEHAMAAAVRGIRRIAQIFYHAQQHFALMETMTTRDYLGFRDKLSPASGFQSAQMREIEIIMGLQDEVRIALGHEQSYLQALRNPDGSESAAYQRVVRRLSDVPTLRDALDDWLYRTPIGGSSPQDEDDDAHVARFLDAYLAAYETDAQHAQTLAKHEALTEQDAARLEKRYEAQVVAARAFMTASDVPEEERARRRRIRAALALIEGYREFPLLAWPRELIDAIVTLEQAFVIFRQRHARMVERIIGRRTGTGGSDGVDYLDQTALRYRIFKDIWAIRTLQVRQSSLPTVEGETSYGLSVGH